MVLHMSETQSQKKIPLGEGYEAVVVEEKYNPLIRRKELKVIVHHVGKGTPSRLELRSAIANAYNVDEERVYIRSILSEFGIGRTRVQVHIYDSPERAKEFEPEHIIKRHAGMEIIQAEGG